MHYACKNGHDACVHVLLQHRAELEVRDDKDMTPLHMAALGGHAECVEVLLAAGADARARGGDCGRMALHWAAMWGKESCITALLAGGAEVEARCGDGWRALARPRPRAGSRHARSWGALKMWVPLPLPAGVRCTMRRWGDTRGAAPRCWSTARRRRRARRGW